MDMSSTRESLCDRSATDLTQLIATKEISPRELLVDCEARIEAVNPAVNAVVAQDPRAAAAAEAAEAAVLRGDDLGPLHGLPLGIKDLSETEGLATTFGSPLYAKYVPKADDALVARLRAAGGLIAAKTNTPEFGAGANTTNKVYGVTGNPFDPAKTPAGSSGGSAVALATSMLPLCSGSDLGGSLRTPAAYCGVVGLRPTPGLVPDASGQRIFSPLSVEGPMGRSVADLRLLLSAMAGEDPRCPLSRPGGADDLHRVSPIDPGSRRVGFSEDLGVAPVSAEVRGLFRSRVAEMAPLFKESDEVTPPLADANWVFETLRAVGFLAGFAKLYAKDPDQLGPNVRANVALGLERSAADVAEAQVAHAKLYRAFQAFHEELDFLICPVASVQPFDKTQLFPETIDGQPLETYISWIAITYAITLTGCPTLVLPCGLDEQGLPFGIQIVGKPWQEAELLAFGAGLEAALAEVPHCRRPSPDLAKLTA
ncbi:MAG: amidase family protein [Rhodospirillales bacterium]